MAGRKFLKQLPHWQPITEFYVNVIASNYISSLRGVKRYFYFM